MVTRHLGQVTSLLLSNIDRLGESQIIALDDVLVRLIERTEAGSLAQLSEALSSVELAPRGTIRKLAFHNDQSVAAPVLKNSSRLSEKDLIEIAQTLSQQHLLAIAGRKTVSEALTDALMRRGDANVSNALAHNPGAAFSECGYATLVGRAERDESLTEKLGLRLDLPANLLRELLAMATDVVRARFLTAPRPVIRDKRPVHDRRRTGSTQGRLHAGAKPGCCAQSRRQAQRSIGESVCGKGRIHQRAGSARLHDGCEGRGNRAPDRERPALRADRGVQGSQAGLVNNEADRLQSARLPAGHPAGAGTRSRDIRRLVAIHSAMDDAVRV